MSVGTSREEAYWLRQDQLAQDSLEAVGPSCECGERLGACQEVGDKCEDCGEELAALTRGEERPSRGRVAR